MTRALFTDSDHPLVSAVIPTRDRPGLLAGAVHSALRQTWPNMEVVVVIDGPNWESVFRQAFLNDPRVRIVVLPESRGGSEARNAGVRIARGEWIAFLDDDDEWFPEKIDRQMRTAHAMPEWFPVISCRVIAQSGTTSRVLPLRPYQPPQPIGDYLFCRSTLRDSGGVIQTSTLLVPRDLLVAIPFQSGLTMHQDWDWILRVTSHKGVAVSMLRQPLAIWRVDEGRESVGRNPSWQTSLSWIRSVRSLISPRAFAWFIAVQCAWRAQRSREGLRGGLQLLRAFLFEGQPEWRSVLSFLIFAFVPTQLRQQLRKGIHRRRKENDAHGLRLVVNRARTFPVLRKSSF
jgi:glycosyltransferase involved in cell wall biosynthesis